MYFEKGKGFQQWPVFLLQKSVYIYFDWVFVCLSVRLYPINFKTGEPIVTKFCVQTSLDPRKGLLMNKILKICLQRNSISIKF